MSKTINSFETRKAALDFAAKHNIAVKEVRRRETPAGRVFYRLIVTDAVYKRWAYAKRGSGRRGGREGV